MCFSSTASFVAGATLTGIGALTVTQVRKPEQLLFAFIPLLFAAQQFCEGFVWLSFMHADFSALQQPATYFFLIIAQVLWPLIIPLSLLLLEKQKNRKRILFILSIAGIALAAYRFYWLMTNSILPVMENHHIDYVFGEKSHVAKLFSAFYLLNVIGALFISGVKRMWLLGVAVFISFAATELFYEKFIISVWCYFAALISMIIYYIIRNINRHPATGELK